MQNKSRLESQKYSFQEAYKDFKQLKQARALPKKMECKLDILLKLIEKKAIGQQQIQQIPYYEKQSLQAMNNQEQKDLFCNLIKCLSGKDTFIIFKNQKSYVRKEQLFQSWNQSYMTCDSKSIYFKKKLNKDKNVYTFPLKQIKISKSCTYYKKKHIFGLKYQNKHYLIGFDTSAGCSRIHGIIKNIAKQKDKIAQQKMSQKTQVNNNYMKEQTQISNIKLPQQSQNNMMNNSNLMERLQILQKDEQIQLIFAQIQRQNLVDDSKYSLLKNYESGRTLTYNEKKAKIKSILLLNQNQQTSLQSYIQSFIKMNQWNEAVQKMNILHKIGQNQYIIQMRLKKYSMMSYQREVYAVITAFKYQGKIYLHIKSSQVQQKIESKYTIADFLQIVQISVNQNNREYFLMTIITQIDHKGYNTVQDNFNMTIYFLKSLQHFQKYYLSQSILSSKKLSLFNFNNLGGSRKKLRKQSWLESSQGDQKSFKQKTAKNLNLQFEKVSQMKRQMKKQNEIMIRRMSREQQGANFATILFESYTGKRQQSLILIQLIKNKKIHQNYYLHQNFDMQAQVDQNRHLHIADQSSPANYIYRNNTWGFNKDNDLVFIDQESIKAHKDIIKYILKQISSNLFSGKSVMNMSLPVQIFQDKTLLQRYAEGFGFMPKFILQAARTSDFIQQIKCVFLFYVGMAKLQTALNKPFNPILGETFTCKIGGIPVYFEQVSHHPPISNFYIKTTQFQAYGSFESHIQMGMNSAIGRNLKTHFWNFFKTKTSYEVSGASIQINGLMYGQRKVRYVGSYMIHQKTNDIFCEVSIGKAKKKIYQADHKPKSNQILGGIYKVTHNFGQKFRANTQKYKFQGLKYDDVIEKYSNINGSWIGDIFIDGKLRQSLFDPIPNKIQLIQFVLPSDSNLRFDVILKRCKQLEMCQQQKQILENIQRRDRKLRAEKGKSH